MAQYVYTMNRVGKIVPPKRKILENISLSFFPGAKIGVLGLNGSGKSTLLRIMAGLDTEIEGEARPQPGIKIGYLPQEPQLDPEKDVRGNIEEALADITAAQQQLEAVYAAYAEPDADFDALAAEQARLENILQASDGHNLDRKLEVAADALRLPPWDADVSTLSGGERRRVALCKLLLSGPDMLLLDEPTNHLDLDGIAFLEKYLVGNNGHLVGNKHLFPESDDKSFDAVAEVVKSNTPTYELGGDVVIADNGAGNQLGEKSDVQPDVQGVALDRRIPAVNVHGVRHGLKSEKGDSDG